MKKEEDVKLNIIPQLEVILKSIDLDNEDLLKPILESNEVDILEKQDIRKYIHLLKLSGAPNIDTLKIEFPARNFEVDTISIKALSDYIQIYLYNKKSLEASKTLMELSSKVRSSGITEDVLDNLGKISKSDAVRHKFVDIKDNIVDRYENEDFNVGLRTGVNFVDKMVRWNT